MKRAATTHANRTIAVISVAVGLAMGSAALAHHSFAMFDFARTVTLKGVVREFQWTNPHVILWVVGTTAAGGPAEDWSVELTSPGNLTRLGWSKRSVKTGDRVLVDLNPLRDGQHGGGFRKLTLADTGQVLVANLRDQERPGLQ